LSLPRVLAAAVAAVAICFSAAPAAAAPNIGAIRICSACAAKGGDLARFDYVVLHAWEHARIAPLKAANPNIKVLVYKESAATVAYGTHGGVDDPLLPAGVGYGYAASNHPEWFLDDTTGRRVEWSDYPGVWQMDVGNSSYQDTWLANVLGELRRYGWDGVMLDDVMPYPNWHLNGRTLAKYPTIPSYTAATRSFLARVCSGVVAGGFLALPNIGSTSPENWRDWIRLCSGAVQEYWTKWGQDATMHFGGSDWTERQRFLQITQEENRIFLGVTYAPHTDFRSMRYARANFLLDWNGSPKSVLAFEPTTPEAQDPYHSEWTVDVGLPSAAKYTVGGIWRRDFTKGVVLVNPSAESRTVDLGASHTTPAGESVRVVTLASKTGLVLRGAPTSSQPRPASPVSARTPAPPSQPARTKPARRNCSSRLYLAGGRPGIVARILCAMVWGRRSR
jgi:Hypothetical glycosyl hydrolase family 15